MAASSTDNRPAHLRALSVNIDTTASQPLNVDTPIKKGISGHMRASSVSTLELPLPSPHARSPRNLHATHKLGVAVSSPRVSALDSNCPNKLGLSPRTSVVGSQEHGKVSVDATANPPLAQRRASADSAGHAQKWCISIEPPPCALYVDAINGPLSEVLRPVNIESLAELLKINDAVQSISRRLTPGVFGQNC